MVVPPIWRTINSPQSKLFGTEWFQDTLHRFQFTELEWLPSTWLTNGLLEAARPPAVVVADKISDLPIVQSVMYLATLVSQRAYVSRPHGVGGKELVSRQLCKSCLPAGADDARSAARFPIGSFPSCYRRSRCRCNFC